VDVSPEMMLKAFLKHTATYDVDLSFGAFMSYFSLLLLCHSHNYLDSAQSILHCKGDELAMYNEDLTSKPTLFVRSLLRENGYSEKAIKEIWKWYAISEPHSLGH